VVCGRVFEIAVLQCIDPSEGESMGLKRGAADALMVVAEEGLLLADELLRYRPGSIKKIH
jgi:hypothetical protein